MNVRQREATPKQATIKQLDLPILQAMREFLDPLPIEKADLLAVLCVLRRTLCEIAESSGAPAETARSRMRLARGGECKRLARSPRLAQLVGDRA
jgi:DNA-directed RNA polymerase specialized sigma24 family protein